MASSELALAVRDTVKANKLLHTDDREQRCNNGCRCGITVGKIITYYKWGRNINIRGRHRNNKDVK